MILLGTIYEVFKITGRGVVIVPEFLEELDPNLRFHVGEGIQLLSADGLIVDTRILGIEFLSRLKPVPKRVNLGILLPPDLDIAKVSQGMEIRLLRDN